MTHLLVANPTAQSGRNAGRIERALRSLRAADLDAHLLPTRPHEQTIAAVRDAVDRGDVECVIAMGGDGTFREVAAGLLASARREDVPLAMLPAGTANNHGRSFGLSSWLARNVAVIAARRETRLDAGLLHTMTASGETIARRAFFDSAGWGTGARVIAERNVDRRRIEGRPLLEAIYRDEMVYAVALARTLARAREKSPPFGVSLVADGEARELDHVTELLIKGTPVYAGRWVIDRTSRHDDGLFEVAAFPDEPSWLWKAAVDMGGGDVLAGWLRARGQGLVKPFRISRLTLRFHVPRGASLPPLQLDGEELPGSERAEIDVLPRALRLIVP